MIWLHSVGRPSWFIFVYGLDHSDWSSVQCTTTKDCRINDRMPHLTDMFFTSGSLQRCSSVWAVNTPPWSSNLLLWCSQTADPAHASLTGGFWKTLTPGGYSHSVGPRPVSDVILINHTVCPSVRSSRRTRSTSRSVSVAALGPNPRFSRLLMEVGVQTKITSPYEWVLLFCPCRKNINTCRRIVQILKRTNKII